MCKKFRYNIPVVIFGYAFPHRKTYDFITILFAQGFQNITVIGAPKVNLTGSDPIDNSHKEKFLAYDIKSLCSSLNINFQECAHNDIKNISSIKKFSQAEVAIISGARIIAREVIALFQNGIVNFHPGKIPETSGLDSFYYSIKNNCSMGVTAHLINHKVDAGRFIFFEKLRVSNDDSIEATRRNIYGLQLKAFTKYLRFYFGLDIEFASIDRPHKNSPLSAAQKEEILLDYSRWRDTRIKDQFVTEEQFFKFCKEGSLAQVKDFLNSSSYLLHHKSPEGWSAIIIAAFWQRFELVKYLLDIGSNPNDQGKNGTSVLMYAKTKLVNQSEPDLSLIGLLLEALANVSHKDNLGKNIFDYLNPESKSGKSISNYLKNMKSIKPSDISIS